MSDRLLIPVYLNQRIVLDLLAMLEGGICQVTRVASVAERTKTDERKYGASFGLSQALSSLLSIRVSGKHAKGETASDTHTRDEERVHTPASLFYRLRAQLLQDKLLHTIDGNYAPCLHDFVEFTGVMVRNPILQTIDSMISLIELAALFTGQQAKDKAQQKQSTKEQEQILKQMKALSTAMKAGETVDMVTGPIIAQWRSVLTLETEYLNDPSMADLVDGTFTVVGKVIRVVETAGEGVSLMRKSALSVMPPGVLDSMVSAMAELSKGEGFKLPSMEWNLSGPAFQVLPIAVFA